MANEDRMIEMADALVASLVDEGVRKAREGLQHAPPPGYDGTCPECGNDVPTGRQALGFYNCVECQEITERRGRLMRS